MGVFALQAGQMQTQTRMHKQWFATQQESQLLALRNECTLFSVLLNRFSSSLLEVFILIPMEDLSYL